jgi:thiamine-monophosphate kinase
MVDSSEDSFISEISKLVEDHCPPQIADTGIGDDAALLSWREASKVVVSVDDHCEDVHFRRAWCPPAHIGRRAAGSALSDLAAMGAQPRGALLSLQCPRSLKKPERLQIVEGLLAKLATFHCPLIGGNVTESASLNLSVTVIGQVEPQKALTRCAPRASDDLWLSGALGRSWLAWQSLEKQVSWPEMKELRRRYLDPTPRFDIIEKGIPEGSGCMDISDGLARDAHRMARAAQLVLVFDTEKLKSPLVKQLCQRMKVDPDRIVYSSGEEYELLFSIPTKWRESMKTLGLQLVGQTEALAGRKPQVMDSKGQAIPQNWAFDHFSK